LQGEEDSSVADIKSIITALAEGASAQQGNGSDTADLKDAYANLKNLVAARVPLEDLNRLEQRPRSQAARAVLEEELEKSGAQGDPALADAARNLLNLLRGTSPRRGSGLQLHIGRGSVTILPEVIENVVQNVANASPDDVQAVAANQIGLLLGYHQIVQAQSRRSFDWALIGAGTGLAFFIVAAGFTIWTGRAVEAIIPAVAGASRRTFR
jgi:hypothetical protein